jgi:hypothetical protein
VDVLASARTSTKKQKRRAFLRTGSLFRTERSIGFRRTSARQRSLAERDYRPSQPLDTEFKLAFRDDEADTLAMDSPATYLHWGFILISWPNLLVILGMLVVFAIALVAPFPNHGEADDVSAK